MRRKNNIAHYRIRAGLSQSELAERMEVRQSTLCNWEQGVRCPSASRLIKLAKMLGVTAEELLGE